MSPAEPLGVRPGPHRERLSCVEANLEAVLGWHGVTDVRTALGALSVPHLTVLGEVRTRPAPLDGWVRSSTGLAAVRAAVTDPARLLDRVAATVAAGTPVLVTADAHGVPWSPYRGHEHHEHGFVLDGVAGAPVPLVAAVTNPTPYGAAAPVAWGWPAAELAAALAAGCGWLGLLHLTGQAVPDADPLDTAVGAMGINRRGQADAVADGADVGLLARTDWTAAGPDELAWLSLATWSLSRARAMHGCWWAQLAERGVPGADGVARAGLDDVDPAWQRARSAAYLAWRRVEAGRACPPAVREALAAAVAADADWTASTDRRLTDLAPDPGR